MHWVFARIASDPGELKEGSLGRRDMCNKRSEVANFSRHYSGWIENSIRKGNLSRDNIWTTELAVGSKSYVEQLRLKMGYTSKVTQDHSAVHDEQLPYGDRMESNMMEWEIFDPREFSS